MVSGIALIKKNMENLIIFFSIQPLLFIFNPLLFFQLHHFLLNFIIKLFLIVIQFFWKCQVD